MKTYGYSSYFAIPIHQAFFMHAVPYKHQLLLFYHHVDRCSDQSMYISRNYKIAIMAIYIENNIVKQHGLMNWVEVKYASSHNRTERGLTCVSQAPYVFNQPSMVAAS